MSDQDLVSETVGAMLARHEPFVLSALRPWDAALWSSLAEAGLTTVGLREDLGGSGGELMDAVTIVRVLAAAAAAVPVAEQSLVAGPALEMAGLRLPSSDGPLTVALSGDVSARASGGGWILSGSSPDVPWAAVASAVAVIAVSPEGFLLAVVPRSSLEVESSVNLAGEPRGAVAFGDVLVSSAVPLIDTQVDELRARYTLARAVQLSAALERILAWTVHYAAERHQFGRPLSQFQAIQMELAEMAGEVTAVAALVDATVQALSRRSDVTLAAAAAKIRAGAAVEVVARRAHQIHGAIGFTQEYKLHHLTRRCWSWRDEGGTELQCSKLLGARLVADDGDGFWPALTRVV
jgi:acyl-CoA dehydrogenase